jgi:hypothetical protein
MENYKYILFFNKIGIAAIDQVGEKMLSWGNYITNWILLSIFLMDLQLLQLVTVCFEKRNNLEKIIG